MVLHHYKIHIDQAAVSQVAPQMTPDQLAQISQMPIEVWIGVSDGQLHRISFVTTSAQDQTVSFDSTISDINGPVSIAAPTDAKSLSDVLSGLMTGTPVAVTANLKSQDAKVKTILAEMIAQSQLYRSQRSSFGTTNNRSGTCFGINVSGTMFSDTQIGLGGLLSQLSEVYGSTSTLSMHCDSNSLAWAVSASLPSGGYYCVDSAQFQGPVKSITAADHSSCAQ